MNDQKSTDKKYDLFLILLLLIVISVFIIELYFSSKVKFGSPDVAFFYNLGENILKGKGFVLDFVDEFFIKFNSVSHPEDWGFPMMGIIAAPFIYFLGKTPMAVKIPIIFIGTILFPILTYYLGKEFFDKKIGFLSAISVLFYARTFGLALSWRDTVLAFFLLGGVYFFYKGLKEEKTKYFLLMGLFLGLSYLVRQTMLIVLPTLILVYYLIKKKFDLKFINGIIVTFLVISPWLIRSYLIFGDPFFTANRYAQWIFGWYPVYEEVGFKVFWGIEKPSLSWLISSSPPGFFEHRFVPKILNGFTIPFENLLYLILPAFIGLIVTTREKIGKKLLFISAFAIIFPILLIDLMLPNIISISTFYPLFHILGAIPLFIILYIANIELGKESSRNRLFALLWLAFVVAHGIYVFPADRYFLPLIVFFFIFSWAGTRRILELASERFPKLKKIDLEKILFIFLLIFLLVNIPQGFGNFFNKDARYPYRATAIDENIAKMGELIKEATKDDDVIMTCASSVLHYNSDRKTVDVPSDSIGKVVEVIKAYNVSHISFVGCGRRKIDPILFDVVFGSDSPPPGYGNVLFKINFVEKIERHQREITFNAVAWLAGEREEKYIEQYVQ